MKLIKIACMTCCIVLASLLSACGADNILHGKSDHWDVSLQRSTGSFNIVYIGEETKLKDIEYDISGTNIKYQGKASNEQEVPFHISGPIISNADKTKDPITFRISWNDQSESVTFE
ncbi:hypothetical protein [Paenibacillus sp. MER 99-2]|uniref:hypothetical protein n=1 Tax=Paenibacillus sp. MER 99-2 TaxID=2939572 RepID=UPI00203EF652|nr:hypothetical protein [Paenibacillus sp. MER 99-2]MCM3172718.1 hypothetical protein [Paenibacillus sp. MER 99-2]